MSAETLDLVAFGIILLDARGKVTQMNRAATAMAHRADGFRVSAGEIIIETFEDAPRVRSLVAEGLRTAAGDGLGSGGSTFVTRTSGGRPYHFVIAPLRAGLGRQTAGAVAVLISDPLSAIVLNPSDLRSLYGLTGAESLLASQLLGGLDVTEAARRLGIAVSTARTHLKRIFSKTETRRQSELVALLLGGIIQRPEGT